MDSDQKLKTIALQIAAELEQEFGEQGVGLGEAVQRGLSSSSLTPRSEALSVTDWMDAISNIGVLIVAIVAVWPKPVKKLTDEWSEDDRRFADKVTEAVLEKLRNLPPE
jgi:hypothetical protein